MKSHFIYLKFTLPIWSYNLTAVGYYTVLYVHSYGLTICSQVVRWWCGKRKEWCEKMLILSRDRQFQTQHTNNSSSAISEFQTYGSVVSGISSYTWVEEQIEEYIIQTISTWSVYSTQAHQYTYVAYVRRGGRSVHDFNFNHSIPSQFHFFRCRAVNLGHRDASVLFQRNGYTQYCTNRLPIPSVFSFLDDHAKCALLGQGKRGEELFVDILLESSGPLCLCSERDSEMGGWYISAQCWLQRVGNVGYTVTTFIASAPTNLILKTT